MKRFFYTIFLLSICGLIIAQEYQITEIENIAYSFFNRDTLHIVDKDSVYLTKQIASIEAIQRDSVDYMYIANAEHHAGWVILANEKNYSSIIASGDSGNLTYDKDSLPPALLCLIEEHMDAIDSTRNDAQMMSISSDNSSTPTVIFTKKNLIDEDYWNQSCNNEKIEESSEDKIYNKYCERNWLNFDGCYRAPTGCGPVAMAKIMRYWQWPDYLTVGEFSGINDTTYYYDWKNMPRYIDNSTDMYQVDAVAHLFRSCGRAATTWYTHFGSATMISVIHDALKADFGFHSNLVRAKREGVNITAMLINEIDAGRPVLVQAHDKVKVDGHSFVVDGYRIHSNQQVMFHVHFGLKNDNVASNNYCDLTFRGYPNGQVYLIELYPECSFRADDVSLNNILIIGQNDNRTYYSTNNITLGSNHNLITVNNGGHLLVKAGNEVRIKDTFYAKAGSDVHIMIDPLCYTPPTQSSSDPQRIAPRASAAPTDDTTEKNANGNPIESIDNEVIVSTSIYTISGQLIQTIAGGQRNLAHLPNGMYILQHRMSDGSVKNEKIANNK